MMCKIICLIIPGGTTVNRNCFRKE